MTRFIIFTAPRSGSTVLTRTLDEHPEIFCAGELFHETSDIHHPEWYFPSWNLSEKNKTLRKVDKVINYPNLRLRSIPHIKKFYEAAKENEKARGFKVMFSHIKTAPYIWNYLKEENVKVIVLIRKNIFRTALSRFRKAETRIPHSTEAITVNTKFYVSPQHLLKQLSSLENVNKQLLHYSNSMKRIVINYEDFENWNSTLHCVFNFLQVTPKPLQPVLNKVGAKNWCNEVENYEEVEKVLQQNNYTQYLS